MTVNGVKLNFDFTSPTDMLRYQQAAATLKERAAQIPDITKSIDDPDFISEYTEILNQSLKAYGDFIDEVFGGGVANKLLGNNPSLTLVLSIYDDIEKAMEQQGKELGAKMQKYAPNRATRRKKKTSGAK